MMNQLIGFVLAAAFTATGANFTSAAVKSPATEVTGAVKQESNKLYSNVANYDHSFTALNFNGNTAKKKVRASKKNRNVTIDSNRDILYFSNFNVEQWLKDNKVAVNKPATQPTPQPTAVPTPQPTVQPTPQPTVVPAPQPTVQPTPQPTVVPTPQPTVQPTPQPTVVPAPQPTVQPTPQPTVAPTPQPTVQPTPQPTVQPAPQPVGSDWKALQDKIFELTNVERQKNGVAPFVYNATVEKYAVAKSQDMAINNYFDHNSPTNGYFYDIWNKDGFKYSAGAENIYYMSDGRGFASQDINALAQQIVTGWMNSEGHRKNILNPSLKELGVGVAVKDNRLYATQQFHTN